MRKALVLGFAMLVAVVAIDQATKAWALSSLTRGESIPVLGDFLQWTLVFNPGAAFSFFTDSTIWLTILAILAVIAVGVALTRTRSVLWAVTLGAIGGGAAGNLIDRFAQDPGGGEGHVIDFINNGWFVGNVADIALVVGVIVVAILEFTGVPFKPVEPSLDEDAEAEVSAASDDSNE